MERLTGADLTSSDSQEMETGKERTLCGKDGNNTGCPSPAHSPCLNRKRGGCCGERPEANRIHWESVSAFAGDGRNDRNESTSTDRRGSSPDGRDREHISGAAELACVLLFGHTMTELLESRHSPRSK